jgi:hypothetical protein
MMPRPANRQRREPSSRFRVLVLTPEQYEQAVLQRFQTDFPPPRFQVAWNVFRTGESSGIKRQIDVCVFEQPYSRPLLIVEAKRHKRTIDVGIAGGTISLVRDLGGIPAVMVASSDFSRGALNYLGAEEIDHLTITLDEARGLNMIPLIERAFAPDNEFREVSGHLVEALRRGDAEPFLAETDLLYEEWLAVMKTALDLFPKMASPILFTLAADHYDDTVRFNAIRLLDSGGYLTADRIAKLLEEERDPDTVELLQSLSLE